MNKRLMRTSLLAPISLALLFVATSNAFGQAPNPDTLYQITARHSGKCLDVSGGELYNGAPVIQWDCHGGDNQQWRFDSVGAGYYKIIAKHSGKALDVFGGIFSTGNNVDVQQRDYNGSTNQMWSVNDLGNGYYSIIARHSNKSLDIRGASTHNGAQAHQWDYVSGTNQQWKLIPLAGRVACTVTDPLISTFTGMAELRTTNPNAPGPFGSSINLSAKFGDCHTNLSITNFPPISHSFDVFPLGRNTSTITMTQGGFGGFDSSNGRIVLPITLRLENSNIFLGNSTLPLTLVAAGAADMKNPDTGSVTLRGTGTFVSGALNGSQGTLTVTGTFSPRPR